MTCAFSDLAATSSARPSRDLAASAWNCRSSPSAAQMPPVDRFCTTGLLSCEPRLSLDLASRIDRTFASLICSSRSAILDKIGTIALSTLRTRLNSSSFSDTCL